MNTVSELKFKIFKNTAESTTSNYAKRNCTHQQLTTPAAEKSSASSVAEVTNSIVGFVTAMNSKATRLGMSKTRFANPHGLSTADHLSTTADLATLAKATLSSDLFKSYDSTRQRGASVQGRAAGGGLIFIQGSIKQKSPAL